MNSTDASVSSTSEPLAEESANQESPKEAPGADEADRNLEEIDRLLAGIVAGLVQQDTNPDSRLKLIAQLNKVSERTHRRSMENKRLKLDQDRFEYQREVKRQELEIRRHEAETKRLHVEMKRQEIEARREKAKGKAGFEAPTTTQSPTQAPVNGGPQALAKAASPDTAIKDTAGNDRETSVRGFKGGTSQDAGTIRREAVGTLWMNGPTPTLDQNALIWRAFLAPIPGDKPALTPRGSLEANPWHGIAVHGMPSA